MVRQEYDVHSAVVRTLELRLIKLHYEALLTQKSARASDAISAIITREIPGEALSLADRALQSVEENSTLGQVLTAQIHDQPGQSHQERLYILNGSRFPAVIEEISPSSYQYPSLRVHFALWQRENEAPELFLVAQYNNEQGKRNPTSIDHKDFNRVITQLPSEPSAFSRQQWSNYHDRWLPIYVFGLPLMVKRLGIRDIYPLDSLNSDERYDALIAMIRVLEAQVKPIEEVTQNLRIVETGADESPLKKAA